VRSDYRKCWSGRIKEKTTVGLLDLMAYGLCCSVKWTVNEGE